MCADISELAAANLPCSTSAPAWKLLTCVANQCLTYDSAVLPPDTCVPLGRALDAATSATAKAILGDDLSEAALAQLRIGRKFGGCELRSAEHQCHIAFLASTLRLAPFALTGAAAIGVACACETAAEHLAKAGVFLDDHCVARAGPTARCPDFRSISASLPKRQRHLWDALDTAACARMAPDARQRMEECSGTEGGAYLLANRVDLGFSLTNAEFVHYTRLRLGADLVKPGPCQLTRVTKGEEHKACGVLMDAAGRHCIACKIGGAVHAAHAEGCNILASASRDAGYFCRREQIIPELATKALPSPVLDCDAFGLAGASRLLIDFTLRCSTADRYRWGARSNAAASAEADKGVKYPAQVGVSVRGAGMEVYGKHGPDLSMLLAELADRARAHAIQHGRAPTRFLRKWRCQLSAVCARLVGRQVTLSQAQPAPAWERTVAST